MTKVAMENLDYTLATHAIEHLVPSEEARRLCVQRSEGTIDISDALREIAKKYGVESRKLYG